MGDFAKALSQIPLCKGGLRGPGRPETAPTISISEQLRFLRDRSTIDSLPPGDIETTPLGSHYVIHGVYPHDYFHGKVRLSRFSSADLECLMKLMREKGSVAPRDRIVFLDTETTGMQGGAGMCPFLVGLGYFVDDEFHVRQYFIRDFDEEPSMLQALAEFLRAFQLVVTYNGAAFDIPLLETRFTLARLDNAFEGMSHLDLLTTTRRLWRNGHGSCRLVALEREIISFSRGPDVPGSMIPRAYFDYIQRRPTPMLKGIFTHNLYDVVSLAALTLHACDRVTLEPAPLDDALDLYSLARVFEHSSDWLRSIQLYEMALDGGLQEPVRKKALEDLSVVYRRAGDHERSREICADLMAHPEFSMAGYLGAAIYYERIAGDFENALRVLQEGLQRAESKRWTMLLKARWDRLQQKVIVFYPVIGDCVNSSTM